MESIPTPRESQARRPAALSANSVLANRFQIIAPITKSPFGEVYRALDKHVEKPVAIRVIRPDLLSAPGIAERVAQAMKALTDLDHKNVVRTHGVIQADGMTAVVTQFVDGQTLRAMIAAKEGEVPFSLKGAYNIFAHLCNALSAVRETTFHGAVTPTNVLINRAGRVKLSELGLARLFPSALSTIEAVDRPCLPPEMQKSPGQADPRADLYCLGAILFELLTGKMYMPGMLPRRVNPGLPGDVDPLITLLLAPKPEDRFKDPAAAKAALAKVLEQAATSMPRMSQAAIQKEAARPSAPHKIVVDDSEYRWLVSKGKLDFGPFTLAQIKAQIAKDEIVPGNILIDQENGKRAEVEAHPLLRDLVLSAAQRRDDARRANVEATVVKQDVQKGAALYGFIALGVAAVGLAIFLIFKFTHGNTVAQIENTTRLEGSDLAGLKVSTAKHVDDRAEQRQHKATHPHGNNPGGSQPHPGGGDAWENSQSFDMMGADVGDERLEDWQINDVIGKHSGGLGHCLQAEVGRGGTHTAEIDFIVLGSGHVSAVRVNGQTGTTLAGCIRGAMQSLPFPSFNGPRTKASFSMSL